MAQADALDKMLKDKRLALDAVIEMQSMTKFCSLGLNNERKKLRAARRADDNAETPEGSSGCLSQADRAAVAIYHAKTGALKQVDGMQSIEDVTASIKCDPRCLS